jgi:amidophosphoribosyltransferase
VTADSLAYLSEAGMYAFLDGEQSGFCDACFTGRYPVPFEDTGTPRQLVLFEAQEER